MLSELVVRREHQYSGKCLVIQSVQLCRQNCDWGCSISSHSASTHRIKLPPPNHNPCNTAFTGDSELPVGIPNWYFQAKDHINPYRRISNNGCVHQESIRVTSNMNMIVSTHHSFYFFVPSTTLPSRVRALWFYG